MFDIRSYEDIKKDIGPSLGNNVETAGSFNPFYPLILKQTNIANGSTVTPSVKMPTGYMFAGWTLTGLVTLYGAQGGALDNTPLVEIPSPTVGSNTMYTLGGVDIQLSTTSGNLFDQPVPFMAAIGSAENPMMLAAPVYIAGGEELRGSFVNNSGATVEITVILWGRKIRK